MWPVLACLSMSASGHINGYAEITALSANTLTVGTSNETASPFLEGREIILMQMQDDVIGPNTQDNAQFGTLDDIRSAGLFTTARIASVSRSGDVLTTITLSAAPGIAFHFGPNASVQAITYELLGGGGDYTTTAAIDALPWNGRIGGVVALQVAGALTLKNDITADGKGFRGGAKDPTTYDVCYPNVYRASSVDGTTWRYATKGEGIYRLSTTDWADGRGRIINGGGGGNGVNAGGGGGGNFTAGGQAGPGYSCTATPSGGLGGADLGPQVTASRVFLGGGGGGGEGNDNVSTDGGAGGGIILIKAAAIKTAGSTAVAISANGAAALNAGNDGAGGGGAGGAVILQVSSFNVIANAPLAIRANGGNGGAVAHTDVHGGGGGGGQGTVIFSTVRPTTNITVQTNNGAGGCNNSSSPCNSLAASGVGTNGSGILQNAGGVLPIELLRFGAVPEGAWVKLSWATASERDNAYFAVDRSTDARHWEAIAEVPGAGNSMAVREYTAIDEAPLAGTSYYRLQQTDLDGSATVFDIVPVHRGADEAMRLFPNPAQDEVFFQLTGLEEGRITLTDGLGRTVHAPATWREGRGRIDVSALPPGPYVVTFTGAAPVRQQWLVVRH